MDSIEDLFAQHVDPRGAKGEPSDDMAIARRMPIAALVAVLAERGAPMPYDEIRDPIRALLWFADEGHYQGTYRRGAGFVDALGIGVARRALGLPIDREDGTMMPLSEAIAQTANPAPVERTPETVLRAMLKAYEAAALDATVGFFRALKVGEGTSDFSASVIDWQSRREIVFDTLAATLAGAEEDRERVLNILSLVRADYEARLAGTRPLDAPPMEAP